MHFLNPFYTVGNITVRDMQCKFKKCYVQDNGVKTHVLQM